MKCERCDHPSKVHLAEMKNGKRVEHHLCPECAKKESIPLSDSPKVKLPTSHDFMLGGQIKCERCGKPSVVHLTEIESGRKLGRHLCAECAKQENVPSGIELFNERVKILKQRGKETP